MTYLPATVLGPLDALPVGSRGLRAGVRLLTLGQCGRATSSARIVRPLPRSPSCVPRPASAERETPTPARRQFSRQFSSAVFAIAAISAS